MHPRGIRDDDTAIIQDFRRSQQVGLTEAGLPLPGALVLWTVLALSTVKALLVALYYMHLKLDRRLLVFVVLVPFLIILLALGVLYSSLLVRL